MTFTESSLKCLCQIRHIYYGMLAVSWKGGEREKKNNIILSFSMNWTTFRLLCKYIQIQMNTYKLYGTQSNNSYRKDTIFVTLRDPTFAFFCSLTLLLVLFFALFTFSPSSFHSQFHVLSWYLSPLRHSKPRFFPLQNVCSIFQLFALFSILTYIYKMCARDTNHTVALEISHALVKRVEFNRIG